MEAQRGHVKVAESDTPFSDIQDGSGENCLPRFRSETRCLELNGGHEISSESVGSIIYHSGGGQFPNVAKKN